MKEIKLEQFLDFKFLSNLQYSPDGKRAVFAINNCDKEQNTYVSNFYLYEKGKIKRLSSMDKESTYFWEDNTHILFPACRSASEKKRAEAGEQFTCFYRLATNGGESTFAYELPISVGRVFYNNKKTLYFTSTIDKNYPDLYKASKKDKEAKAEKDKENEDYFILEEHPFCENGGSFYSGDRNAIFVFDGKKLKRITGATVNADYPVYINGKIYYLAEDYEHIPCYKSGLYCYDVKTEKTTCIHRQNGDYFFTEITAFGDNLAVFMTKGETYGFEENPDLYVYNVKSGKFEFLADVKRSIYNMTGSDSRHGYGKRIKFVGGKLYYTVTDRNSAKVKVTDGSGNTSYVYDGEGSIDFFDVNDKGEILCVAMLDGKLQELYSIIDGQIKKLSSFNDKTLKDCYLAEYEKISVMSGNVDIDGWILKPKDFDKNKSYPAILDIHGGPKTVYGEVYYHEMQYWANHGYFVFFCNPTGSDGRGDKFADIYGKYGQTDYKNIMDFTDKVLEKYPCIDKSRVAVTGGSYGGFMTNWIIGHTDRFCCAATQRSISNWTSFVGTSDIGIMFGELETKADIYHSPEKLWQQSPIAYADNFKTPTLIIHSDADYRCPIEQGYQLFSALQEKNVPCKMVVFKGENHELSRGGKPLHRIKRLKEITDWIDKYTKNN